MADGADVGTTEDVAQGSAMGTWTDEGGIDIPALQTNIIITHAEKK